MINKHLYRVCALFFLVSGLSKLSDSLITYFSGGSIEDSVSGWYILAGIVEVIYFSIALAKIKPLMIKIWATLAGICVVPMSATYILSLHTLEVSSGYIVCQVIRSLLNPMFVLCVFSYMVGPSKNVEEESSMNLRLLQFCAVFMLVNGLNVVLASLQMPAYISLKILMWGVIPVLLSIFVLLKKNILFLEIYGLIYFVAYLLGGLPEFNRIFPWLLHAPFIVYGAAFFIDPSANQQYLQRVKTLFERFRNFT